MRPNDIFPEGVGEPGPTEVLPRVGLDDMQESTFTAKQVRQLRERAWKDLKFPEKVPQGWSKSPVDPTRMLEAFDALSLRKGYTLRAYQYREGGKGAGYIWAMPADDPFPEPRECAEKGKGLFAPPRPPHALDHFMMVLVGDKSLESYLQSSIFNREALQLGAVWHGQDWSTYEVVDRNPIHPDTVKGYSEEELEHWRPDQWRMRMKEPPEWRPSVQELRDFVRVKFYTLSELVTMSIYLHVDMYIPGTHMFLKKESVVATGPRGIAP